MREISCCVRNKFVRSKAVQAAMNSLTVIFITPFCYNFSCMVQRQKPLFIEAFIAEFSIEAFYERILCRDLPPKGVPGEEGKSLA